MKIALWIIGIVVFAALVLFAIAIKEAPELDDEKMEM